MLVWLDQSPREWKRKTETPLTSAKASHSKHPHFFRLHWSHNSNIKRDRCLNAQQGMSKSLVTARCTDIVETMALRRKENTSYTTPYSKAVPLIIASHRFVFFTLGWLMVQLLHFVAISNSKELVTSEIQTPGKIKSQCTFVMYDDSALSASFY